MAIETFTIYPSKKYNLPPAPTKIDLHGLDLLGAPINIHNHRFYQGPIPANAMDTLKSSLAEALELYPPVSGTVQYNDTGLHIALDDDNIQGTLFLVEKRDTPFTCDSEDLSPRTDFLVPAGACTLAVKVTEFSCGTLAIASSIHHQVTDLRGFLDFLEIWAQRAREEPVDLTQVPNNWLHTPSRFFATKAALPTTPPPPFRLLDQPSTSPPAFLLAPSKITRWKLTKDAMTQLKADFSPKVGWISSGDALAALISGTITRARHAAHIPRLEGRSSVESETEGIAMAADGRDRAGATHYFGNFNPLPGTTVSRQDLLSTSSESASRVAVTIRHALNKELATEALASRVAFFEHTTFNLLAWSADVILTNWCKNDLQGPKLDMGWGKPFKATDGGATVFPPGYSIMTQVKDTGDVFVLMTVEAEADGNLKADPVLIKYATIC